MLFLTPANVCLDGRYSTSRPQLQPTASRTVPWVVPILLTVMLVPDRPAPSSVYVWHFTVVRQLLVSLHARE